MNRKPDGLNGVRVFVVEDEFAVLLLVEDMLADLGCVLVGTASRMLDAVGKAQDMHFDAAVLDVNINGEPITPVAEVIEGRRVPIVFTTGYGISGIDPRWRDHPVLQKPYRLEEFAAALERALGKAGASHGDEESAKTPG
ncbi:MAG: response regulator [Xanthobacteraceae bacterium]